MSPNAPATLEEIYAPIHDDVDRLARFLRDELASREPFILEILEHMSRWRGKQIRPALLFLVTRLFGGEVSAGVIKIGAVLELIHTATLVHDDLLDDATLRRGLETVHQCWGDRAAILIGDFIYSRAFQLSTEVHGMAAVLSRTTHTICEGELLQIGSRRDADTGEERYFEIIRKKTAELYAIAMRLGGQFAGADAAQCESLHAVGLDLGTAFQIVDDCLDYEGDESVAGKSLGTDLRQGKVTLPLIYLRDDLAPAEAAWLRRVLREPLAPDVERRIQALVRENGALAAAFACAESFVDGAKNGLARLCGDSGAATGPLRDSLELAADYMLRRRH